MDRGGKIGKLTDSICLFVLVDKEYTSPRNLLENLDILLCAKFCFSNVWN
jgi:hypothetical protein